MNNIPPYNLHMGFETVHVESGRVVVEAEVGAHLHNPVATLHGGVLAGLADSAMGQTVFSVISPQDGCTNVDLNLRFLRGIQSGRIRSEGRIVKQGRRVFFMEADVVDDSGQLLAKATATFLVLPNQRA